MSESRKRSTRSQFVDETPAAAAGRLPDEEVHLGDLVPDPANCRKHNERNIGAIVNSLQNVGAARSIVIDEHNTVLAGNGMVEAAGQAGIERVLIVEADGNTVVAVRRRGLTPKQKAQLAIGDNRTAELATWDNRQLLKTISELEINPADIEFSEAELERLADQFLKDNARAEGGETPPAGAEKFLVVVTLKSESDRAAFIEQMEADGRECRTLSA